MSAARSNNVSYWPNADMSGCTRTCLLSTRKRTTYCTSQLDCPLGLQV